MEKARPTTAPKTSQRFSNMNVSNNAKANLDYHSEMDEKNVGDSVLDFKVVKELGRGSYGTVFLVISCKDGKEYVVKKILLKNMKEKKQKESVKEVQILRKLDHYHIIKYYNSFLENDSLHIIMEYAEGGDLAKVLYIKQSIKAKKEKRAHFSEEEIWKMADEMCSAISYLHSLKIIHRDIKTLNIFLTKDGRTKVLKFNKRLEIWE